MDPLTLAGRPPGVSTSPAPPSLPSDGWKDCQSPDTETRLVGCTKVIDAKGPNRIRLADAFDGRCSAYNQKQQYYPALADCKSAIDLNPKYSYAYANLGAAYIALKDSSNAVASLNKAVALKTNFFWSRLSRAKAFEASGSNEDALKDYQYALLIDPANQEAKAAVVRLMASAPTAQSSNPCVADANEQGQYLTTSASGSSASGVEGVISTIASAAQRNYAPNSQKWTS
jgi:tetratricopeptide (TPR) repeat protein